MFPVVGKAVACGQGTCVLQTLSTTSVGQAGSLCSSHTLPRLVLSLRQDCSHPHRTDSEIKAYRRAKCRPACQWRGQDSQPGGLPKS